MSSVRSLQNITNVSTKIKKIGGRTHMQVRPLHDRVLVKRFNEEDRSKGGIIIPDMNGEISVTLILD